MISRAATAADAGAIAAIWNPFIRDTTVTFSPDLKTAQSVSQMIAERQSRGFAFDVVLRDGAVTGFATYAQFRAGAGYARSMEHTIILAPAASGSGGGRILMAAMEEHARKRGAHSMMAGVSGENTAGLAFHRALGYAPVAVVPQVGYKFGRWLDLHLMQKFLNRT